MSGLLREDHPPFSWDSKIEKRDQQQWVWEWRNQEETDGLWDEVTLVLFRFAKISSEFDKLNSIIQDLRKENQALKQSNYEIELKIKGTNFTEDKVIEMLCRLKCSTMR